MKSLGALILLGAANYVAAQTDYQDLRAGGEVKYGTFGGVTRKLIKDSAGNLKLEGFPNDFNLKIVCERASRNDVVPAWDNLSDEDKAFQPQINSLTIPQEDVRSGGQPDTSAFSKESILVYACKVLKEAGSDWSPLAPTRATNSKDGTDTPVATQGNYVRVHYAGKCALPITDTVFSIGMNADETYDGTSTYIAPLTLTAKFPCIEPMGFTKQVALNLQYKPTDDAKNADIVVNAVTNGYVSFTKIDRNSIAEGQTVADGKTFIISDHKAEFDLGAEKPHPDYYKSGVLNCDSNGDESLCKGGLKATLSLDDDHAKKFSVATKLVDYTTLANGFKFKPCSHNTTNPLAGIKEYDYLEACYGEDVRDKVKAWTSAVNSAKYALASQVAASVLVPRTSSDAATGSDIAGTGSLLTDMICPFTCKDRTSASCPLTSDNTDDSTSKSALECLSVGVKHTAKLDDGTNVLHTPKFWDNRCAARTDGKTGTDRDDVLIGTKFVENLRTPYSFTHRFTKGGGNQEQYVNPSPVNFKKYTVPLHSDVIRHDVTMTLSTGGDFAELIDQAAFYTVEGDGFVKEVPTLNTDTLVIKDVPTYVGTLTLKGQVFKTCAREKVDLSNAMTIDVTKPLKTSGVFRPVNYDPSDPTKHNPCNRLFEYVRDGEKGNTAYTISGVLRGSSFEANPSLVKMCNEDPDVATGTSCARATYHSSSVKADYQNPVALLEGLCSVNKFPRDTGVIGALVAFSDQRAYAPVICPGTCQESTIHNVSLDWDIELAVSASDNPEGNTTTSDFNKLIVRQETSDWGDDEEDTDTPPNRYYDLERVAYLIPATRDDCQADGTLSIDDDSIPTNKKAGLTDAEKLEGETPGCLVYKRGRSKTGKADWANATEYEGIVKAADMVDWFKACGSQTALGAEVNLVQRFKVTYGDERDISFCQTKKLSVTVQPVMVGESTQTLTTVQQADSQDDASIEAVLNQVQYTAGGCESLPGSYRLQAVADIITPVDITADYEQSPNIFQSELTKWTAPASGSNEGQFTWSTECLDLCASQADQLIGLSKEQTLQVELRQVSDGNARLSINFNIDMEGSPCDDFRGVNKALAELTLYNAGDAVSNPGSDHCETAFSAPTKDDKPRALTDMVCGRLSVTNLGDSKLYIMRTKLTRQLDGSAAELLCEATGDEDAANGEPCVDDPRNVMFRSKESENTEVGLDETDEGTGAFIHFADSPIKLFANDSFATLRYTIFWEQRLGGRRRLLRSEMILGAGESSAVGDLVVLPISDQIEDALESLEEGGQAEEGNQAAPTDATTDEEDSGLSGGVIAVIIVASVAVVVGAGYVVMQGGSLPTLFKKEKRSKNGYSVVRRSERFSTMNF